MSDSKYNVSFEVEKKEFEYILLEPGEYPFEISEVRYGDYNGSDKLPPCPKAIVDLDVDGGKQGHVTVTKVFYLCKECAGIIASFAQSLGVMDEHETTVNIDFAQIEGMKGIVYITHRTYNGQQYNDIKKFIKKVKAKKNYDMF